MTRPHASRALPFWILSAALLLSLSCGGGGGGGGGGTPNPPTQPPPPPAAGVSFTPSPNGGGTSVALRDASTGTDTLVLEVVASQFDDLYGVAFDLLVPGSILRYQDAVEGDILDGDGSGTSLQVASTGGSVIVGVTRLGGVEGVDGTGTLLTLRFQITGNGSGSLVFDRQRAVDSTGAEIPGVSWAGGDLQVAR